jgi:hypothetical protein
MTQKRERLTYGFFQRKKEISKETRPHTSQQHVSTSTSQEHDTFFAEKKETFNG